MIWQKRRNSAREISVVCFQHVLVYSCPKLWCNQCIQLSPISKELYSLWRELPIFVLKVPVALSHLRLYVWKYRVKFFIRTVWKMVFAFSETFPESGIPRQWILNCFMEEKTERQHVKDRDPRIVDSPMAIMLSFNIGNASSNPCSKWVPQPGQVP